MKVRILSPLGPVLDEEAEKISFESLSGSRTFLPNHIDMVSRRGRNVKRGRHGDADCHDAFCRGKNADIGHCLAIPMRYAAPR